MTLDQAFQFLVSCVVILVVFGGIMGLAALMTWGERKLASMIQDRIGPNRADLWELLRGIFPSLKDTLKGRFTFWGLFHILADPTKLFLKEDFVPRGANKVLHSLAPMLSLGIPLIVFVVFPLAGPLHISWKDIPVEDLCLLHRLWPDAGLCPLCSLFPGDVLHLSDYTLKLVAADLDVGMLFVFAVSSLAVYGVILAGWSSNNKFSFLGAVRGANQMISYEVGLGLSAIGLFMIYGGVSLTGLVEGQAASWLSVRLSDAWTLYIPKWGIFTQPLAFILFLTCGMAEIKRIPFDLPEGESEIVAGYFTEYSSMKFTMFMFGEYVEMILLAAVITTIFFGGYDLPGVSVATFSQFFGESLSANAIGLLVALIQVLVFAAKTVIWVYLIFMIRWSFPRFRYDQLMKLGWKMVLPLALVNLIVTGVVISIARGWW